MAEPSVNPYAPPESPAESTEPPAHGWSVQGEYLVVRDGTILPPDVDIDGHGAGGSLTPVLLRFLTGGTRFPLWGFLAMVVAFALLANRPDRTRNGPWVMVAVVAAIVLGMRLLRRANASRLEKHGMPAFATLKGHASVRALRARARRTRWRSRLIWLGLLLIFMLVFGIGLRSSLGGPRSQGMIAIGLLACGVCGLLVFLGTVLWQGFDGTWRCPRVQNGWLYLKGVGPAGLAALATRTVETPPIRRRKVFTAYLHRMPLAALARPYPWNPWAWCYLGLLKLLRSKALVGQAFQWSERQWLEPAQGDPDLWEEWRRDTAGTPLADWQPVHAERQDGPNGNVSVNELVFLSPNRRHVATAIVIRVANGRIFLEVRDHGLRSWTSDGRMLGTGSELPDGPLPEEIDYRRVTGTPWQIAQAHLQRTASEDLVTLDPAAVRGLEETEYERRRQSCEAAGIYGPVEEQEFAG